MPIERQRQMAEDAGCGAVYEHGEFGKSHDARDTWAGSFRPGDKAWFPRMDVLPRRPGEGGTAKRVGADLAALVARVAGSGATLVEGSTGVKSTDSEAFAGRVEWAVKRAHLYSRTAKKTKSAAATARAAKEPGLVLRWRSPAMKVKWEKQLTIWQSHRFTNDADAMAALDPELAATSTATVRRVFHPHGRRKRG